MKPLRIVSIVHYVYGAFLAYVTVASFALVYTGTSLPLSVGMNDYWIWLVVTFGYVMTIAFVKSRLLAKDGREKA
ncbi:MAG TPA: hypothetical protein VE955_11650 [Candidatus Dormibacteraeota bacterium]|nr:hypothetical protein [Candidatus Dormibacteraeota bacterium]